MRSKKKQTMNKVKLVEFQTQQNKVGQNQHQKLYSTPKGASYEIV